MMRTCTRCRNRYRVLSLDNATTCPACGHFQLPAVKLETPKPPPPTPLWDLNPKFIEKGKYSITPMKEGVRIFFSSRMMEMTMEELRSMVAEAERITQL